MTSNNKLWFNIHAERLFAELDRRDPSSQEGLPKPLSTWNDIPCLIMLGEPGSGKTREFKHQVELLQAEGHMAVLIQWRDWLREDNLLDMVQDSGDFETSLSSGKEVWLFIDSLDEGRVKTQEAFEILSKTLKSLQANGRIVNLKLRLSCRSREWRSTEQDQLSRFFSDHPESDQGKPGIIAVTLLPLDKDSIRLLSKEKLGNDHEVDEFFQTMVHRHIYPLSGQPLLLAMMLSLFHESGALGQDRTEIYQKAVEMLSSEENSFWKESGLLTTLPRKRLIIAKQIAAFMIFGAFETTFLPDRDDSSAQAFDISISITGEEKRALFETLSTGLFTQRSEGIFQFVHRSLGEYLAASLLSDRLKDGLSLSRILPLFAASNGAIPTPLRETAAWLAGFNPDFRSWLIETDPVTAALGDTIRYTSEDCERIIEMLALRFENRNWQGEFDRFGDLGRSVDSKVLQRLTGADQSQALRHLAIDLINAAQRKDLNPLLLTVAMDPVASSNLRTHAARVLADLSPSQYCSQLSALLSLPANEDPEDEIVGTILHKFYPEHIPTQQALSALHTPRNIRLFGVYRFFWEFEFSDRIPLTDCPFALDTFERLLPTGNSIRYGIEQRMAYSKIFTALILRVLSLPNIDVAQVGAWLVRLTAWEHGDSIAASQMDSQGLVERIKMDPDLKKRLLVWRLNSWPDSKEFNVWINLPYPRECSISVDFDLWVEIFRQFAYKENIGKSVFGYLGNFLLVHATTLYTRLETIEELVEEFPFYLQLWDGWRFTSFQSQQAQSEIQERVFELSRKSSEDRLREEVRQAIPQFRSAHSGYLFDLLQRFQLDHFGDPPLTKIGQRFGEDVADAVSEGLIRIWNDPLETEELWDLSKPVSWPPWATMGGFGLLRSVAGFDWTSCSSPQIELAIWLALRNPSKFPEWFPALWAAHRPTVWGRLVIILDKETESNDSTHPHLWCKLAQENILPNGLLTELNWYLLSHGMSSNHTVLSYQLRLVLKKPELNLVEKLSDQTRSYWNSDRILSEQEEPVALMMIAAWWILDSACAHSVLEHQVITGENSKKRAIGFIAAIRELSGSGFSYHQIWPSNIPWKSYTELLPLLYVVPPRAISVETSSPDDSCSFASHNIGFFESRTNLVSHIANGPISEAREQFAQWVQDERFGEDRDWFARLHAEICQRETDTNWMHPSSKDLAAILDGTVLLVNNDNDFFMLLCDMIGLDLCQILRSDYSLVPLLWEGSKGVGRTPLDEKALQSVIYNQIMLLLKNRHIVGAREPEVFDAKKPDFRISITLTNGLIVHVPIEIKWSHNNDVWTAMDTQLVRKYMQDPRVRYGLYLVGWSGSQKSNPPGPEGQKPETPVHLEKVLREISRGMLEGKDKTIGVHVLDFTVLD